MKMMNWNLEYQRLLVETGFRERRHEERKKIDWKEFFFSYFLTLTIILRLFFINGNVRRIVIEMSKLESQCLDVKLNSLSIFQQKQRADFLI